MMAIDEIRDNFALLDDWDDRYRYVIELGRTLAPMPETEHSAVNKVQGCASQVWLSRQINRRDGDAPVLNYLGDSDAHIVRGLIAILLTLYSGHTPQEILATDAIAVFDEFGFRDGVGGKNLLRRVAGIKCQQDCDQSAHDMRVAVTEIVQHWCVAVAAVDLLGKPDLAGAALHLVGSGMLGFGHRSQGAAEFDDIPIAVVPIVQQRKIIPDFVDRHHVPRSIPQPYIGSRETESDIAGSKSK